MSRKRGDCRAIAGAVYLQIHRSAEIPLLQTGESRKSAAAAGKQNSFFSFQTKPFPRFQTRRFPPFFVPVCGSCRALLRACVPHPGLSAISLWTNKQEINVYSRK